MNLNVVAMILKSLIMLLQDEVIETEAVGDIKKEMLPLEMKSLKSPQETKSLNCYHWRKFAETCS